MSTAPEQHEVDDALATVMAHIADPNDEQARAAKVLAAEVRRLRQELAAEEHTADYVLTELANEHSMPRYSTEAVDAMLAHLAEAHQHERIRFEDCKTCVLALNVQESREPPL